MNLFDLHCDTLTHCLDGNKPLFSHDGQLDLKRGTAYERWVQVFACWLPPGYRGEAAYARFLAQRNVLVQAISDYPNAVEWYTGQEEIHPQKCQAILAVEGGHALGGELGRVAAMAGLGVRFLTLVWNGDNELGSGAVDGMDRGLTGFGKDCLREMRAHGIVTDISHLNDRGIDDVFAFSDDPVVATHSNLRSVCGHPRNLREDQFAELIRRKGLCGINYYPAFVNGGKDYGPDALRRHLERMLELGGEDIVALGSDFDGASMPHFLLGIEALANFRADVVQWFGEEMAEKLFYQNALRFTQQRIAGYRG